MGIERAGKERTGRSGISGEDRKIGYFGKQSRGRSVVVMVDLGVAEKSILRPL